MHLWVRAECRETERRVALLPEQAARLVAKGVNVTVERSDVRIIPIEGYEAAGCKITSAGGWENAPEDAFVLGLKELPDDGSPLRHKHIMFGHAFKHQPAGKNLLKRFAVGGGELLDLEYLVDEAGKRVAAFGYWAGFAGAAVSIMGWLRQKELIGDTHLSALPHSMEMIEPLRSAIMSMTRQRPSVLIIGALGRVGTGAREACEALGLQVTLWDQKETAQGGPFHEIFEHDILLNCILARSGCRVFVPEDAKAMPRSLSMIGDIACDPESDFSPIKVYNRVTTWDDPYFRASEDPVLEVMAIDNLPSLLPLESSEDFSEQLFPFLLGLCGLGTQEDATVWERARQTFVLHVPRIQ